MPEGFDTHDHAARRERVDEREVPDDHECEPLEWEHIEGRTEQAECPVCGTVWEQDIDEQIPEKVGQE